MVDALAWLLNYKGKTPLIGAIKPRITFITSSMNLGGAERQLLLLCNELKKQVEIEIITLDADGPLFARYKMDFPNIKVVNSNEHSKVMILLKLRNQMKISRPDLVVTWLYKADILGGISTKLTGKIPVVWSARNSKTPKFNFSKKWILALLSKILPVAIVANGNPAVDFHKSIGYPSRKFRKIENLLAPWITTVTSKSRLLSGFDTQTRFHIGLAARQVSGKGILETISAVEKCNLPIDLQIIGQSTPESLGWQSTGKYRNYDVQQITDDEELSKWFENLDLYLMSSNLWESQPNSLLEAIAIGCPVLVSDKIKLDFETPSEFVFDSSDKFSLNGALDTLIRLNIDDLQGLVSELQEFVLMKYSRERIINEWLDIIRLYKSLSYK